MAKANIYQSYSMVDALSSFAEVKWYRGFNKFKELDANPRIKQLGMFNMGGLNTKYSIIEKISRAVFCLHTLIHLKTSKVDKIFTRDFGFIYFYSMVPSWFRCKADLIYESHKVMYKVSEKVSQIQERKAYQNVHLFICVSDGIKNDLHHDFKIEKERILVNPSGFKPELFPSHTFHNLEDQTLQFVYAGSFERWKGVETILEAASIGIPSNTQIHIVGGTKEDHDKLCQNQSIESDYPVNFHTSVKRKKLFQLYSKMNVGIVSTIPIQEGEKYTSPIKFFEYVNAGLLVLSSDIQPMKDLSKEGFHIEFYEAGSSQSLREAIHRISIQGIDQAKILENKKLVQSYSWNERARKIVNFIS
jgi:glycosyltransferase involved in cell wall biosynthesis